MAFIARLFGSRSPIDGVRKAVTRSSWSEAIARAEEINRAPLLAEEEEELDRLLVQAGDALAHLNLAEADACLRSGDKQRAQEHLELAIRHGRSQAMLDRAQALASSSVIRETGSTLAPQEENGPCTSGCCPPAGTTLSVGNTGDFDTATRLELLLSAYPDEILPRYLALNEQMATVVLAAHEDDQNNALQQFDSISEQDRDDLYWFERGLLLLRNGRTQEARQDLERVLAAEPSHRMARENLVDLLLGTGDLDAALSHLETPEGHELPSGFRPARLALLAVQRVEYGEALDQSLRAVGAGCRDENIILIAAQLLEERGELTEAERHLLLLPSLGCSGPGNLPLAEFRLRNNKDLGKALDTFRGFARHDPTNPFWALRLGQTYLALRQIHDARPLLEAFLVSSADETLISQARAALAQINLE